MMAEECVSTVWRRDLLDFNIKSRAQLLHNWNNEKMRWISFGKIRREAHVRGDESYDAEKWNLFATFTSHTLWVWLQFV